MLVCFFSLKTVFSDINAMGNKVSEKLRFCTNKTDFEQVEAPGCPHLLLFYWHEIAASYTLLGDMKFPKTSSAD